MKALVSINFALELDDEDDLVTLAQTMDASLFNAIKEHMTRRDGWQDFVELAELAGIVDWYGATISIKKPVLEGVEDGE